MRIGLVVAGGVDRSGRERVVPALLWLIDRIARRHDVHVIVLRHYRTPATYTLNGATVHDVGRIDGPPGLGRWRMRARLSASLRRLGAFDVLHAYQGMPAGVVTTAVARRFGIPVIVTLDSGELVSVPDIRYGLQRRWLDRAAIANAIRAASRVTVATRYMAQQPALRGRRIDVVPIGVDPRAFAPVAHLDGPPWRLLRVGSINRVKDFPTLLHAMRRVVDRLPAHLDVVGEDTLDGSAPALARALDLDRHVTFHGFQPTDRLAALYQRAHLHVVSSRHEAAGSVVLEASCAGLATVGTRVGYVSDWSPDLAVAVHVRDPDALATAIVDLLNDPARRARMAGDARAWTLAHDADWTAAEFERLYREL